MWIPVPGCAWLLPKRRAQQWDCSLQLTSLPVGNTHRLLQETEWFRQSAAASSLQHLTFRAELLPVSARRKPVNPCNLQASALCCHCQSCWRSLASRSPGQPQHSLLWQWGHCCFKVKFHSSAIFSLLEITWLNVYVLGFHYIRSLCVWCTTFLSFELNKGSTCKHIYFDLNHLLPSLCHSRWTSMARVDFFLTRYFTHLIFTGVMTNYTKRDAEIASTHGKSGFTWF